MSSRGQTDTSNEGHDAKESWEEDIDTPSSDSDLEEGEDLKTRLLASMQRSHFDKTPHEFLPRNKFEEIFPAQSEQERYQILPIFKPMEINLAAPTDDDLSLANYILEHCRTLYLVAVFIELKPKFLRTFMSMLRKDGLTDERLPIDMWSMEELKTDTKKHPFVLMEMKHSARKPRIWNLKSISKFQNEQWKFLIPTISTTEIFVDFRQKTIPFIAKIDIVGKGGNAIVYIYEIDPAHFEDPPPLTKAGEASQASAEQGVKKNIVAVKEIRKEGNVAHRWEKEVRALAKMNEFKHKHIVRFITSFRRQGTSDDIEHYVMLEWADGGNLSSFRAAYPNPELTAVLIKWVIQQLCGLAEALSKAHYLEDDGSYRHGDLKPENILWFKQGDTKFGTLKIGDWGEAKEHYNGTALRHGTTTQHGTRRYEPPEVSTGLELNLSRDSKFARSRLYDIWAIGCITLEFLIWLMYGLDGLKEFNRLNVGDYGKSDMFYEVSLGKPAKVHPVAVHWMKHMANDPRCSRNKTALGDLLEIVRTGLLIVKLPREGGVKRPPHSVIPETLNSHSDTSRPSTSTADTFEIGRSNEISIQLTQELEDPYLANPGDPRRCLATDFEREMLRISKKIDESYWYQEYTSKPTPVGVRSSDLLSVETIPMVLTRDASGLRYNESELRDYGTKNRADLENWNFECDNKFAKGIFSRWEKLGLSPPRAVPEPNTLCDQCTAVRGKLWSPFFEKTYELEELERNASKGECDLCGMLWTTHRKFPRTASAKVKFWLQDSMIMMDGLESPVLALFRNEPRSQASDVQIGLADLPAPGKDVHIEILRGWLDECDRDHKCAPSKTVTVRVPTRLIDVGKNGSDTVHLREMDHSNTDDWVALSYRWGPTPHFSTTIETVEDHMVGMSLKQLPQTFRDAIEVTRSLKRRYLWIDSLCIIQGKGGDFREEAERMEDVYSGAYCVLAASCATGQTSGFLFPRQARKYVTLKAGNDADGSYYVCERIENFKEHVVDGELCQRGWVLQEHALARRTIFFTEHQTYWECGEGIRCETLAKMSNATAAFLGDPEFPELLDPNTATKGEQIYLPQELYGRYSRLSLTSHHDRPAAIDGLQKRLLRAMKVKGGYGVFDDPDNTNNKSFLRRSLLWRRGDEIRTLQKINFPKDRGTVPSWSWMAVSGGIDYFHPPFTDFDWPDIKSPWSHTIEADRDNSIKAQVRGFQLLKAGSEEQEIIFDDSERSKQDQTRVIVLGIEKSAESVDAKRHYVLLVDMMTTCTKDQRIHCQRVGAGYFPGKCLTGAETPCALI